jgi:hypothetical protein
VRARARQPDGDGGLPVAEDAPSFGRVQTKGSCRQHHSNLVRRGFQTIQGGMASGSESRVAGRASKRLDPLGMAMFAISKKTRECEDL